MEPIIKSTFQILYFFYGQMDKMEIGGSYFSFCPFLSTLSTRKWSSVYIALLYWIQLLRVLFKYLTFLVDNWTKTDKTELHIPFIIQKSLINK